MKNDTRNNCSDCTSHGRNADDTDGSGNMGDVADEDGDEDNDDDDDGDDNVNCGDGGSDIDTDVVFSFVIEILCTRRSSRWGLCCRWLHRGLSLWQSPVRPVRHVDLFEPANTALLCGRYFF